ncbi:MAG: hypothetical protein ACREVN_09070 [Gammaproteobacteria bacterium]
MWKTLRNILGTVLAALALAACSGYSCRGPQVYESAHSVPPLVIPEDLAETENPTKLIIPRAEESAPERGPDDPCLDQPPDFFEPEAELP